jgi:TniQ
MMRQAAPRQLPVCLPAVTDELLSSWISRRAAFYAVPPLFMLRHCLPEASSLRAADIHLTGAQIHHLSKMLATKLAAVRRMTFTNVMQSSRRLIATRPLQFCANCMSCRKDPRAILRSQLLGWRITCPSCGDPLRDNGGHELPSRFLRYRNAALRGERLLDDEAERGFRTWTSPTDIAQLLLMRRIPRPLRHEELWRFRVLGAIVPGFDDMIAAEREKLSTPARPIIPLHLRPALLAGVAIVERTGPEMLRMLHGHTMGDNRIRFSNLADRVTVQTCQLQAPSQMQLI